MSGGNAKAYLIFGKDYEEKYKAEGSLCFAKLDDETFEAKREVFDDEHFALLEKIRAIYNFCVFEKVLNGNESVSRAMIAIYDKHNSDLQKLKRFVKANYPSDVYKEIFRSKDEKCNYANYVEHTCINGEKIPVKKCKKEEFYKFLNGILKKYEVKDVDTLKEITDEIADGTFLPKILNADNGLFPHQINGTELDAILVNLCEDYPEFSVKDESGYSPSEKIKRIFTFRVPYYVGPLNASSSHAWIKRKEGGKITPWNFDDLVDKAASNEEFIRRMTNKCTYLRACDVLPKGSMYYQTFDTLNQINRLTVDGAPISVELKKEIFRNVYLKNKKVGVKQIKEYLVNSGKCTEAEAKSTSISGFDTQVGLKANVSSYVIFKEKFGDLVDERPDIFENIILWHTLNTDKTLVESLISAKYGDIPQIADNIKWIKGLTGFKDFGRLSKELLCELSGGADESTGEVYTVLNRLYNTNLNFNQLLFSEQYVFSRNIEVENGESDPDVTYEDVADSYASPMVRRGIWQSLKMVDEYVAAVGKAPDKIFVEVTRSHDEKPTRTQSRKSQLLELYKGVYRTDCEDIDELISKLNHEDTTDSKLRQERLYLYYLQLGRCAYTGERIDLDLLSGDTYDVDHIVPQSLVKNDSIENKVLVKRIKNAKKTDEYPLPQGFTDQRPFWKLLKSKGLMSEAKYSRLTRSKPLDEDDLKDFVNRQLVVTNQTVDLVVQLLKRKYPEPATKIVYSKASNVNEFKQKFEIVKCRETNDLHHARDAYLNIVVGNVYDTKFTCARDYYYRKPNDFWKKYNLNHLFDNAIDGAWGGVGEVGRIKSIAAKTSMKVTRYSYCGKGQLFDETIYGKSENVGTPRKNYFPYNQTEKYGGFKSLKTSYFTIVQSLDKKGRTVKTIENIPVLIQLQKGDDNQKLLQFLLDKGYKEPKILVPILKIKSLVSVNGYKAWIAGVTGDRILLHNAQEWFTDSETDFYVKSISKLADLDKNGKLGDDEKEREQIPLVSNRKGVSIYATREKNIRLYDSVIDTLEKKSYNGLLSVRSFCQKIKSKRDAFLGLNTYGQIKVILQLVKYMKCNADTADLSTFGEGSRCGVLCIGKNITDVDFRIIHQSPCGLFERIQKV